jgi:hypothetical protein
LLYWRDDGSTDASVALVEAFSLGQPAGRCVRHPGGERLGAPASFLTLLHLALRGPAKLFAFSDQDDFWLPDKLAHGVAALDAVPEDRPGLYFCARTLADEALRPLGNVPVPRRPPGFPGSLTQNLIPGCCMMMNRAAAELIDAGPAPEGTWHDWWSYLVVSAAGGEIVAGTSPDILYRQHDRNAVGEAGGVRARAAGAIRRGRAPFVSLFWRHAAALSNRPEPRFGTARAQLAVIERARHGGFLARCRALCLPGLRRQHWLETQVFRLWLLLG